MAYHARLVRRFILLLVFVSILGDRSVSAFRKLHRSKYAANTTSVCEDSEWFARECRLLRHLCPSHSLSLPGFLFPEGNRKLARPDDLDDFMTKRCAHTCGLCSKSVTDDTAVALPVPTTANGERRCQQTMMSRRRTWGEMCSCRRRSGAAGLSAGWKCDDQLDRIVYEKQPENETSCCCKEGRCSHEAIRRGDAVQHDEMVVTKNTSGGNLMESTTYCCKIKEREGFGWYACPQLSTYSEKKDKSFCERREVESNCSACTAKLVEWLSDELWYKTVAGWEMDEAAYASYIPCMQTEETHVETVMLGDSNALARVSMANPMRAFIQSRAECRGLAERSLVHSVTTAYREMCIFEMPYTSYSPDLVNEGTCSYDPLDKTINLHGSNSCAEGHRCACPVFETTTVAVDSAFEAASTYSLFNSIKLGGEAVSTHAQGITTLTSGLFNVVDPMSIPRIVDAIGTVAGFGAATAPLFATYAFPLTIAIGASSLISFTGSYVWKWAQHTCSNNVGCYPMDCVEEPGRGCRIRPSEDMMDERNPFWFLPPPTYKCAYKYRQCQLSPCSKSNLWKQNVGLGATNSFMKEGHTEVYNCQPMLYADMSPIQRHHLEKSTTPLKQEYETARRHYNRMRQALEETCPWSRPTNDNVLRCRDKTSCTASLEQQSCCNETSHLPGILQCPENFPLMCRDGTCGDEDGLCKEKGGVKPCPAAAECPWLLPTTHPNLAQCNDGTYTNAGWTQVCQNSGGIRRCPWEMPIMCNSQACDGDYCCATNCEEFGGPRQCNSTILS